MLLINFLNLNSARLNVHHEDAPVAGADNDVLAVGRDAKLGFVSDGATGGTRVGLMLPGAADLLPSLHIPDLDRVVFARGDDRVLIRSKLCTRHCIVVSTLQSGNYFAVLRRPNPDVIHVTSRKLQLACTEVNIVDLVGATVASDLLCGEHVPVADRAIVRTTDHLLGAKVDGTGSDGVGVAHILHQLVVGLSAVEHHFVLVKTGSEYILIVK